MWQNKFTRHFTPNCKCRRQGEEKSWDYQSQWGSRRTLNVCPTHPAVAYIFQSVKKIGWPTDRHIPITDMNHTRQDLLSFFSVFFQNHNLNSAFFFFLSLTSLSCTPSNNLRLWCSVRMSQLTEMTLVHSAWVSRMSCPSLHFLSGGSRRSWKNKKQIWTLRQWRHRPHTYWAAVTYASTDAQKNVEKTISNFGPGIHRIIIIIATKMVTQ